MLKGVPLMAVTTALFIYFAYLVATLEIQDIRENWDKRRCEFLVMLVAHYVPKEGTPLDVRTTFASDNFNFCLNYAVDSSVNNSMAPVMNIMTKNVEATVPVTHSMNMMRTSATSLFKPVNNLFNIFWQKFKLAGYQIARIMKALNSGMRRAQAIAISMLFAGFSGITAIVNFIRFAILVTIQLIAMIVGALTAMSFIPFVGSFFKALLEQFMYSIIGVLLLIAQSAFIFGPGGDTYCVAAGTLVATEKGWKPVETLQPGDALEETNSVEGVLKTVGGSCVEIDGVILSKSHLLFYKNEWIFAGEHPDATPCSTKPDRLYCLNTSTRTWTVKSKTGSLVLRDWEELPEGYDAAWETFVDSLLNEGTPKTSQSNPGTSLQGPETKVWCLPKHSSTGGPVSIRHVQVGDFILDSDTTFTEVLGIYQDICKDVPVSGPNSASWIWALETSRWEHPPPSNSVKTTSFSYSLVTKSGFYRIWDAEETSFVVRDFTEVGSDRIHKTYPFTLSLLSTRK